MASNLRLILDEIDLVRESILKGSYDSLMWHPAYERLNELALLVCGLFPEGDEESSDPIEAVAAELEPCRPPSALGDVLSDAAKAGFAVHFVPIRFDD